MSEQPRLDGDRGAVGSRAGRSPAATSSRSRVAVVQHPVLRPGQQRREPAAHRPAAAAEVVDHVRGRPPADAGARCSTRLGARAAASAGSRSASHAGADPDRPRRVIAPLPRGRLRRRPSVVGHPASELAPLAGRPAQPPAQLGVAEPGPQRGARAPPGRRAGRAAPAGAVGAVPERLGHPADLGGDDRQAAGQRLGDDHAVRLRARGEHEQVGARRSCGRARRRCGGPRSAPGRPARRRGRGDGDAPTNAGSRSRLPTQTQRQSQVRVVASASSSTSWPLPGVTAATQSSAPPPAVPGASSAASTPRLGDVHALARQRVQLEQAAAGPGARRDDGRGGREHRALALRRVVVALPAPERHVHEHDQPQPARLRHEHLGRGARRPARRAARRRRRGSARGRAPRAAPTRVGPRPRAGHRARAPPAERGEPAADAAVVGVAAARPGRVVDALGDDDVHAAVTAPARSSPTRRATRAA